MATFVLVHGATAGGWIWRSVPSLLREAGQDVYTPTLTGLGERRHLFHPDLSMETHILDILNVLMFEDLYHVILVGHSYGGAVITGVAERAAERLSQMVYLDAFVPQDGEAVKDLYDPPVANALAEHYLNGGKGRSEDAALAEDTRFTAHPLKTFVHPLQLKNEAAKALPRTFIFCTDKAEMGLRGQGIIRSAERARAAGWGYHELHTGHHPMWTLPRDLTNLLLSIPCAEFRSMAEKKAFEAASQIDTGSCRK
jgi:pimeloyl-ACP methyl ester carboxylesterase